MRYLVGRRATKPATSATGTAEEGADWGRRASRDRGAPRPGPTFEPQIVKKRQRRLNGVDEIVLSLYAKGLTTGAISAHFAGIYGASVSKEIVSRITEKVVEEMQAWAVRPLDEVCAAVFIAGDRADLQRARDPQHLPLEAFSVAAADRAKSRYSWDRIAHETLAVYDTARDAAMAA